jgi:hypothetical protein
LYCCSKSFFTVYNLHAAAQRHIQVTCGQKQLELRQVSTLRTAVGSKNTV